MEIPAFNPHPLKEQVKKSGLRYWQLSRMLGGSPSGAHIGNMLNGIYPMTDEVENGLRHILAKIKKPLVSCK